MDEVSPWGDWFRGVLGGVVDKAASAQWTQPYDIQRLQLQALGQNGFYTEGQRTAAQQAAAMNPTTLLLVGAAVVAVLLLKD